MDLLPEERYKELKEKYGNNPANVLVELALPHINAKSDEKKTFRTDWQSQFATKQEAEKELKAKEAELGTVQASAEKETIESEAIGLKN